MGLALLEFPLSDTPVTDVRIFGGRFRVERLLKQGHGVTTWFGVDEHEDRPVVIKTAARDSLSLGAQMRLEHEAGVLRQIRSPFIAALLELGWQDDLLYLVMPLVEGITLEERLRRGPLRVRDSIALARCLMTALQEVHDQGVLHRDLKPANIILHEGDGLPRATLIDFGLARSARLDASIRDQPVGTARYMSPEQAGLLDQDPDERADLYSAGVVLFEILAGRPPFAGQSVGEVLRQHMTLAAPELRSLGVAVPRALDEVIQRLLRKDPRDRYQSAEAVLADMMQISAALDKGLGDPPLVVGLRDRRRTLTEPAFVGRDAELAALDLQGDRARQGEGGLVLLEAESGGGKSRLLLEAAQRSARRGFRVFRGQGLDQTAQRPFQVLVGVASELIHICKTETGIAHAVATRLGEQRDAVCAALPELAETLGSPSTEVLGPESFGQARSLQALAALLDALGTADRPVLVILDDCQWADESTLRLLGAWQRRRLERRGARHVFVVVAFRSDEVAADHFLRTSASAAHLTLAPFQGHDIRRLAESMAGPLPSEALAVVEQLSEGSPFMAAAVLQGLVESGALLTEPNGWRVEPLALADVQSSRHAAAFLVRRIELLPVDVVELLSAGAVLGKEFDLGFAAKLARQAPAEAIVALDEARRRHIVWARRSETNCAFIHDKLRQTLLDRLQRAEQQELHRRAALHLEEHAPDRVFELAYHFDAAELHARALPYALAAAAHARAQHSLEIAEQQYQIAGRGVGAADRATRFRIAEGLGNVTMLRGRYDEAAKQFEAALGLAEGQIAQAEIEGKLGELAFKRGDVKTATIRMEHALRQLGRRVPSWSVTFLALVVWEVLVQVCHSLCPRFFVGRRRLENLGTERLALRMYSRLAHLYWFGRGTVAVLWAHLRGLNRAELYPPTPELAQAYSEHAPAMSLIPWFSRGIKYAEKSLEMRKQFGDLWGQGQSLHYHGIVLYAASCFREAIAHCREAVRLLERTGDYWEVNIARFQIAASLYRLGDLPGAVAEAQRMHQSGVDLGDAQASGISLDVWARASLGQVAPEMIHVELARATGDVQRNAQVLLAAGVRLYYAGRPVEATEVLQQARDQIVRGGIKNAWVSPVLPWLATALRQQAEAASTRTPGQRQRLMRQGLAVARQALRVTRKFQNEHPHALRECAILLAMKGRPEKARKYFDKSLAVAERIGAIHEHAQTLLARGQVGVELCWPGAAEDIVEAQQTLQQLEAPLTANINVGAKGAERPVTLSLADRFETVLDAGRRIASALSTQAIFAAVREAALKLLRGERCLVLKVEGEPGSEDVTLVSGELHIDYSRAIVKKALDTGHAITSMEGMPDHSSESVLLSGVRSALCAPILLRGRAVGCFYVTHRQVAGLFGVDEERLADFIATLAGAALENAEGFAELHRLNETLEAQYAESQRAEKRIQEQAALLDKARDAISVHDLDGRILYWNQSSERLYGWSAAEVLGKNNEALLYRAPEKGTGPLNAKGPVPFSGALAEASRLVLERGEWSGELCQTTKEGKEITVESRWTLVRDAAGSECKRSCPLFRVMVVNTDVTEKKRLEAQFLRAQRMESIGTLAGGIAHDINNLLLPIMLAVDLLKQDLEESERLTLLNDLERSAHRGADMVKQILSFARGIEGNKVLVQLKHIVGDMARMVTRTFPKSIQFETDLPSDLWVVNGDPTQLYQMVMNLCVNARDAMPKGGGLTVAAANVFLADDEVARLHPDARAGPYVRLTVADTGNGIPTSILDKIFDPFFTTKDFGKGTGLGLSTVLGIVKGHGGFLHVNSTAPEKGTGPLNSKGPVPFSGAGTEFVIYVPAADASQAKLSEHDINLLPLGRGETILVVDDEVAICRFTQRNLEAHGYKVLTAQNGLEAVYVFERNGGQVELLLTDMMMPGMDGAATIKALKKLKPKLRVIAASGLTDVAESVGVDFQAFLSKPFRVDKLLNVVHDVLRRPPL